MFKKIDSKRKSKNLMKWEIGDPVNFKHTDGFSCFNKSLNDTHLDERTKIVTDKGLPVNNDRGCKPSKPEVIFQPNRKHKEKNKIKPLKRCDLGDPINFKHLNGYSKLDVMGGQLTSADVYGEINGEKVIVKVDEDKMINIKSKEATARRSTREKRAKPDNSNNVKTKVEEVERFSSSSVQLDNTDERDVTLKTKQENQIPVETTKQMPVSVLKKRKEECVTLNNQEYFNTGNDIPFIPPPPPFPTDQPLIQVLERKKKDDQHLYMGENYVQKPLSPEQWKEKADKISLNNEHRSSKTESKKDIKESPNAALSEPSFLTQISSSAVQWKETAEEITHIDKQLNRNRASGENQPRPPPPPPLPPLQQPLKTHKPAATGNKNLAEIKVEQFKDATVSKCVDFKFARTDNIISNQQQYNPENVIIVPSRKDKVALFDAMCQGVTLKDSLKNSKTNEVVMEKISFDTKTEPEDSMAHEDVNEVPPITDGANFLGEVYEGAA